MSGLRFECVERVEVAGKVGSLGGGWAVSIAFIVESFAFATDAFESQESFDGPAVFLEGAILSDQDESRLTDEVRER